MVIYWTWVEKDEHCIATATGYQICATRCDGEFVYVAFAPNRAIVGVYVGKDLLNQAKWECEEHARREGQEPAAFDPFTRPPAAAAAGPSPDRPVAGTRSRGNSLVAGAR